MGNLTERDFTLIITCIIIFFVLAMAFYEIYIQNQTKKKISLAYLELEERKKAILTQKKFIQNHLDQTITFPLFFDRYYTIRVYLSPNREASTGAYFDAIADTGNNRLLVSSSVCKTCPKQDGVWILNPDQSIVGSNLVQLESISFGGGQKSFFQMIEGFVSAQKENSTHSTRFGVVIEAVEPSNQIFNICGLCAPGMKDSFLETLRDDRISSILNFNFREKSLTIGSEQIVRFSERNLIFPLILTDSLKFPIIRIEKILADGVPMINGGINTIFDTGTNYSLFPVGEETTEIQLILLNSFGDKKTLKFNKKTDLIQSGTIRNGMALLGAKAITNYFENLVINYEEKYLSLD